MQLTVDHTQPQLNGTRQCSGTQQYSPVQRVERKAETAQQRSFVPRTMPCAACRARCRVLPARCDKDHRATLVRAPQPCACRSANTAMPRLDPNRLVAPDDPKTTCNMQGATCNMQGATCKVQHARCYLPLCSDGRNKRGQLNRKGLRECRTALFPSRLH
jgi:hypothetical protein